MKLREFLDTTSGQNFLGSRRNCYFTEQVLDINNIHRQIVPKPLEYEEIGKQRIPDGPLEYIRANKMPAYVISDRNAIERIEALLATFPFDSDEPIDGCDAVDALCEIHTIVTNTHFLPKGTR